MLSLEGRQLGNYDIIRRIRSGGMGAVYEGRQRTAFGRRVAIKVILGDYAEDREMRRRFAREARTIARLHHPHILPLIEFGDEQGVLYLVMPFIESGTLSGYLRRHLPDLHEIATIFLQLLDAVEYAHEEGLIHRDIKASNVLLESRRSGPPYAYLADFGLVRTIQQAELGRTHAGEPIPLDQVPGTPHYMAPEQTWGVVTPATDIYALGVLLYQLLTGELPYDDPDDLAVIKMHLHAPVPNPCAADASIPVELGAVVARAMAKRAEQRFPDVTAFRVALRAAIDGPTAHLEDDFFAVEHTEADEEFEVHELPPRAPSHHPLPAPSPLPPLHELRPGQQPRRPSQSLHPAASAQPLPPLSPLPPLRKARSSQQLPPGQAAHQPPRTSQQLSQEHPGQRRSYTTEENPQAQQFIPRRSRSLSHPDGARRQPRTTEEFDDVLPDREQRARTTEDYDEAPRAATPRQRNVIEPLAPRQADAIPRQREPFTLDEPDWHAHDAPAAHPRPRWGRRPHLTIDQSDLYAPGAPTVPYDHAYLAPETEQTDPNAPDDQPGPAVRQRARRGKHPHVTTGIAQADLDPLDALAAPTSQRKGAVQSQPGQGPVQAAGQGRKRRKRSRTLLLTMTISLVLLILLLLVPRALGINMLPPSFPVLGTPPVATITLHVQTRRISDTFLFTASPQTTRADLTTRVLPDRSISATVSGSRSIATTGTRSIPGTQASGTLFFSNSAPAPVNVAGGTIFRARNGVQIQLVQAVIIPARTGNVPGIASAPGVAVKAGLSGNLPPDTLHTPCCFGTMVTVSNPTAFSGGSDASLTHLVAQSDLDAVRTALVPGLQQLVGQRINALLASGEAQAGTPTYTITIDPDHPVGSEATQVNVNISIVASAFVYNTRAIGDLARQLLTNEATQTLGNGYQLRGDPTITQPRLEQQNTAGQLSLSVAVSGLWAFQVTAENEQQWKQAIKGASVALAQNYLSTQPGISAAHIALPFGTDHLPTDEQQIVFVVG